MPIVIGRQADTANGPGSLEAWAEDACNEIDAGFFSSDAFFSPEAIARMEFYLARWSRQLERIKVDVPEELGKL